MAVVSRGRSTLLAEGRNEQACCSTRSASCTLLRRSDRRSAPVLVPFDNTRHFLAYLALYYSRGCKEVWPVSSHGRHAPSSRQLAVVSSLASLETQSQLALVSARPSSDCVASAWCKSQTRRWSRSSGWVMAPRQTAAETAVHGIRSSETAARELRCWPPMLAPSYAGGDSSTDRTDCDTASPGASDLLDAVASCTLHRAPWLGRRGTIEADGRGFSVRSMRHRGYCACQRSALMGSGTLRYVVSPQGRYSFLVPISVSWSQSHRL